MKKQTIAILHYHLRPGGVTTVIRNAESALRSRFEVRLLADFGYQEKPARNRAEFLRDAQKCMRHLRALTQGVEVLHAHNLNLGKHPRLSCAVKLLAGETGLRVVNQVHDFAEHGRPMQLEALRRCAGGVDDTFWRSFCYFDLPNVLWTTLTSADAAKLASRGVPAERIHVLPNPVDIEFFREPVPTRDELWVAVNDIAAFARAHDYDFDPQRRILLSPMKVMERKNNLEAVELARRLNMLRGRPTYQLLISMEGNSATDRAYGERLKRIVRQERLPVVIGSGEAAGMREHFHLAHAILTTSRVEGFGYAFVEAWSCGKLVIGRDIPEVTRDFVAEGMDLRHLYAEFDDDAVRCIARLLADPPRRLIVHNQRVVAAKFSLKAYAKRFERLVALLR